MQEAVLGCKLHQRRLHIASAHFPVVSCSWKWLSPTARQYFLPLFPPFSLFISVTHLFHFSLSLTVPPPICLCPENNSIHKLSGHMCEWSRVGPLSVISHNKVNKQGCCVGCLWTQRTTNGGRERQGESERQREERTKGKKKSRLHVPERSTCFSYLLLLQLSFLFVFDSMYMPVFSVITILLLLH